VLSVFAGIWTTWYGKRGTKANPVGGEHNLFGFLTTNANDVVGVASCPITSRSSERMPVQNKTTASEEYGRVQGMLSGLTANVSVMAFVGRERIEAFETAARADALMAELVGEFRDRLAAIGGAEAFEQMSKAYEAFAEANFAFEMLNRGVPLQRTAGTGGHGQKRPDFMHAHGKGPIHFEVKALDIAEPMFRHKEIADEALGAGRGSR
jgi:hypothetical protein